MKASRPAISIGRLCRLLGVTRQAMYQSEWRSEALTVEAELVIQQVTRIRDFHPAIGTRKLYVMLQPFLLDHQIKIGRDALFDLLCAYGLLVRKKSRRRIITTHSYHRFYKYPNLIRNLQITGVNELWVSDITYQRLTGGQWVYISFVTDAYSHKILGYQVAPTLETVYCQEALQMALDTLNGIDVLGLIHHSDRGMQYCSDMYVALLQQYNLHISMTENGDPRENAVAERINGIIKEEYLKPYSFDNLSDVRQRLQQAIALYNNQRPHMSCSMLTPTIVHERNLPIERKWKNYYEKNPAETL